MSPGVTRQRHCFQAKGCSVQDAQAGNETGAFSAGCKKGAGDLSNAASFDGGKTVSLFYETSHVRGDMACGALVF